MMSPKAKPSSLHPIDTPKPEPTPGPFEVSQFEEVGFLLSRGIKPMALEYRPDVRRAVFTFGPEARPHVEMFRNGGATIEPTEFIAHMREAKRLIYSIRPERRWIEADAPKGGDR